MKEKRIDGLGDKVNKTESTIYIIIFIIFGGTILCSLVFSLSIPMHRDVVAELFEGKSLSLLTEWVLAYSIYALAIDFIFTVVLILLFLSKKINYFLPLGIIFIIIIFLKTVALPIGLMLPMMRIMN